MTLRTTFLNSKVARRVFFLFIACALLPITLLAVVAFYQVSDQLRSESEKQLAQESKAQGMVIYGRLAMLDAELQVLALQSREGRPLNLGDDLQGHFVGVTMLNHNGEPIAGWGERSQPSTLTPEEKLHLLSGKALISVHPCSNPSGSCVAMLRMTDPDRPATGMLAGELSLDYLWDTQKLAAGFEFSVLVSSRTTLFCSDPGTALSGGDLPRQSRTSGLFRWKSRETSYDAAYWTMLLKPAFLTDSWTVVLSQKHDDALAPMRHFRNTFPLVILLALWIVMLLSLMQIRRTLVPLEKLQEGTRQIGARHFESRVDVRSGDEFEALALSFNSMASQLGRQFHALKTINDIDQAIFASLNREAIVDATLGHMPDLLPCDCFAITLFDDADSSGRTQLRAVHASQPRATTLDTQIAASDLQRMQEHREVLAISEGEVVPGFVLPLRDTGLTSFLILPIMVDTTVFAALVCAHGSALQIAADDIQQARQVADQLAVAFANVQLIEALEDLHWGTLTALARAIDAKSAWTAGHSERVTNLALRVGRAMGLSAKDLQIMHRGGLLHDIGKIGTPPAILDKPGKLEPGETQIMQDHVRIGIRILEPIAGFKEALPIVSQHHERFDGKGYPEGLAGDNISLHARIFAVADCYDAMTSDRPYRSGLPKEKTLEIMKQGSGTQFDPKIVEVFIRLCAEDEAQPQEQFSRTARAGQAG
jgi:putative nucleotidyltransferase with HDIG domain